MRQKTVTMYPPNSSSLRGASLLGSRFANGSPAETDPESVVTNVIGKVNTSMVVCYYTVTNYFS